MRERIEDAIKTNKKAYTEIRLQKIELSNIRFEGERLENCLDRVENGGFVRALKNGSFGVVSFNNFEHLKKNVKLAIEEAILSGSENIKLADVKPITDLVKPELTKDPRNVTISHKVALMNKHNESILDFPGIVSSRVNYKEVISKVYFANSDGTYIEEERVRMLAWFTAIASKDGVIESYSENIGSRTNFDEFENCLPQIQRICKRAVELVSAPPVKSGEYTVILDPTLSGLLSHEAFGHACEADFICDSQKGSEIMKLGRQFGPKGLNIVDDGTLTERFGGYRYDEEGVPSSKTYLMQDGILCGRLHSRETAYKMSESPTGNARALNYKFEPIVRMSCTSIEPSNTPLKEIISDTRSGIFALSACGGMGGPNEFVLTPAYGFKIKNGKIIGMIRDLKLQGNIFETLRNIDGISTEYGWEDNNCSKGGQNNLPVSWGGPYIRIKSLLVGGKG